MTGMTEAQTEPFVVFVAVTDWPTAKRGLDQLGIPFERSRWDESTWEVTVPASHAAEARRVFP